MHIGPNVTSRNAQSVPGGGYAAECHRAHPPTLVKGEGLVAGVDVDQVGEAFVS